MKDSLLLYNSSFDHEDESTGSAEETIVLCLRIIQTMRLYCLCEIQSKTGTI